MKLLLDTHVWIWSLQSPEKLSARARKLLTNQSTERYLSPISIWEFSHLHQKGRLRLQKDPKHWLEQALNSGAFELAPFSFEVAMEATRIRLPQPDFGDTVLAATAIVHNLTLVTADTQLLNSKLCKTTPAS